MDLNIHLLLELGTSHCCAAGPLGGPYVSLAAVVMVATAVAENTVQGTSLGFFQRWRLHELARAQVQPSLPGRLGGIRKFHTCAIAKASAVIEFIECSLLQ